MDLLYFLLGFVSATVLILATDLISAFLRARTASNITQRWLKQKEDLRNSPEYKEQMEVNAKLREVKELTNEQEELLNALDQPSMNALHSQQKNLAAAKIRDIHDRKIAILKSILSAGKDYQLYFADPEGKVTSMMLSEYLERLGPAFDESGTPDRRAHLRLVKPEEDKPKLDN